MGKVVLPAVKLRDYQIRFMRAFDRGEQYLLLSHPRRAGKDVLSFSAMVKRAIQVPGNYYYLFPTRAWAQRALWDNICEWAGGMRLVDYLCPKELVSRKNNVDFYIDLINGSRIKIDGTDKFNFVGQGGSGYVLSEFSLHKPEVTGFLAPIFTEGNAWMIVNGTMRGRKNHLYQMMDKNRNSQKWFTEWLTLEHTKTNYWINEEEGISVNPELEGELNPYTGQIYKNIQDDVDAGLISLSMARQEYMNLADGLVENSYYGYELRLAREEGRIGSINMDGGYVYTFWDLGVSDKTSIVFARLIDGKFYIIDYYEGSGMQIKEYSVIVNSRGYRFAGHYAPHDVAKRTLYGDLISKAEEVGIKFQRVPITKSVLEDIEICRRQFRNVYIDEGCEDLLDSLENYRENPNSGKPVHDSSSHGADAFRTMIMANHHNLIRNYLKGGTRIELPEYTDYEASEECDSSFWD